ncbi:MAPEG family protein [Maricaulis parjimensis]|uniref:MAPEG family protein n=1 Tax=Maricaulis parjimensis TaxID=144023 RepID=UPI001939AD16|nr:MAPEG family protein [Maricaulis parjimensis]
MFQSMMTPVLGLVCWTLVMWLWMYATRIPAMQKAGIDAGKIQQKGELDVLPIEVKRIADNYNHLHEQPVIFYALCVYSHLVGVADELMVMLAWGYVALRVAHSLIQALWNFVPVRFLVFMLSSVVLIVMTVRNVLAAL